MEYADQSGALNCDYVAAHNAPFDRSFIERIYPITVMGWICTCQAARHVWPDAPNYKNQTLRYYLKLKPNLPSSLAPHRALYDAIVTAEILLKLLEHHTPEELLELSSKRALLRTVGFGKHYGRPWSEMESGYLSWILTKDFDADIEHTARYWLNRKRGAA
jgi:exodeoxyribonuclease X